MYRDFPGNMHLCKHRLNNDKVTNTYGRKLIDFCRSNEINKLSPANLLYKIHNELLQLACQGHDTWAGRVENVIRKCTTDLLSQNAMPLDNKAIGALGNKLRELRYNQFICNWKMD